MGHTNGKISAPVKLIDDVRTVLGETVNTLSGLCRSSKMNIWAKHKPVKYASSEPTRKADYTDTWWKGYNGKCGINVASYTDLIVMLRDWLEKTDYSWTDFWAYDPPTGGTYPYRQLDFDGYKHKTGNGDADKPFPTYNMPSVITRYIEDGEEVYGAVANISIRTENNAYLLSFDDIQVPQGAGRIDLSDMYFGIAIVYGTGSNLEYAFQTSYYKFNENVTDTQDRKDGSYGYSIRAIPPLTKYSLRYKSSYRVFPFLSSVRLWDNGIYTGDSVSSNPIYLQGRSSYQTGVFVPLPYDGKEVTVQDQPVKIGITLSAERADDTHISFSITATNLTENDIDINFSYLTLHYYEFWANEPGGSIDYVNNRYEYNGQLWSGTYTLSANGGSKSLSPLLSVRRGTYEGGGYITDIQATSRWGYIESPVSAPAITWSAGSQSISVSISVYYLSQAVDETKVWQADVTPSGTAVRWYIDQYQGDPDAVSISYYGTTCYVTGEKEGKAYIYCESVDDPSKHDYWWVTVSGSGGGDTTVHVTGISMSPDSLSLVVGGSSHFYATITPSNASNKSVTWTSDDPLIASVDSDGKVTGVAAGSTWINVYSNDNNSIMTYKRVTVTSGGGGGGTVVTGVTLNKTSLSMYVGDTETLVATVAPPTATTKDVTWSSNKTSVATVSSSGKVTANAVGTATITVKTVDGNKTATCTVTVTEKPSGNIPVTGVSLNKSSATIFINKTVTLVATVTPSDATNKRVTWSSSSTSVATVSDGVVIGKAKGTATITAKTADGNYKATCTVTVKKPVSSITLNKYELELAIDESEQLTATVTPSDANDKSVSWSSSNASVATVQSNGTVIAKAEGVCDIYATANDGSGKQASCAVSVYDGSSPEAKIPVSAVAILDSQDVDVSGGTINMNSTSYKTEQLSAKVTPADASPVTYTWSSRNEGVATVSLNGKVTVVAAGTAIIDLYANGYNSSFATASVTIKVS